MLYDVKKYAKRKEESNVERYIPTSRYTQGQPSPGIPQEASTSHRYVSRVVRRHTKPTTVN